jgi:hypothetical protein
MVLQSATPNITLRPPPGKVPIPMTSKLIPGNTIKLNTPKVITAKANPSILRTQNRQGVQLLQTTTNSNVTYVLQQGTIILHLNLIYVTLIIWINVIFCQILMKISLILS